MIDEETFQFWVMSMLGALCIFALKEAVRNGDEKLAQTLHDAAVEARDWMQGIADERGFDEEG